MALAHAVADLISSNLRNGDGSPVECVIADSTIGRVAESAASAAKFEREGVGSTITVTSCWCYGSETMDMNPHWPQAVATMRGRSYLSLGNTCMGIAGSIVNADFLQQYLGMRTEYVSLVEILRRVDFNIFDPEEFKKAMAWVDKYCKPQEGHDYNEDRPLFPGTPMTSFNGKGKGKTRAEKDADWEFTVKTMMIIRDLMEGNPRLLEMGYKEEALGHNAIAGGVQGQRQWTDTSRTSTSPSRCSAPPSTGTASANPISSPRRMTPSTGCRCSSGTCSRAAA